MSDSHLRRCPHRKGDPPPPPPPQDYGVDYIELYVDKASRRGVDEITFTEHLYRCVEAADVIGPFWEQASSSLPVR